ncbi:hypothetical protein C8R47DRAFT_1205701 [Mycena vitilis]|nr:hypothetical protein C8R47DRAFT_1205701 [Mycena vitilis]
MQAVHTDQMAPGPDSSRFVARLRDPEHSKPMGGHSQKKRYMARKASYEKEAKRIAQRIAREAAAKKANEFFSITV